MRVRKQTTAQKRKQTAPQSAFESKVTKTYARQVAGFIERYRPPLEALAKR
jgi:hypothetical protein